MAKLAKVKKWGNRLAVVLPKKFVEANRIVVGSVIDLDGVKVINSKRRRYKLSELMSQFAPEHRRGEWNVGDRVGKEIW